MLIGMACFCTDENARLPYLVRTLTSLEARVDPRRHRLVVVDNASSAATAAYLDDFAAHHRSFCQVIHLARNLGTAAAVNRAWREAPPGWAVAKMDDDVEIWTDDWPDWLEDVLAHDPKIGICGLKRKDLAECPWSETPFYRSQLEMLASHKRGERWLVVEEVQHVFGTCQAYSPLARQRIGYLYQPGVYGFDDALASLRVRLSGLRTVFLPGIEIDHIDPGGTAYQTWKERQAGEGMAAYQQALADLKEGKMPIFYDGGF